MIEPLSGGPVTIEKVFQKTGPEEKRLADFQLEILPCEGMCFWKPRTSSSVTPEKIIESNVLRGFVGLLCNYETFVSIYDIKCCT